MKLVRRESLQRLLDDPVIREIRMLQAHADEPGQHQREEDAEIAPGERIPPPAAPLLQRMVDRDDQRRHHETDRPLDQRRASDAGGGDGIGAAAFRSGPLLGLEAGQNRCGHEERQRHVEDHDPGKADEQRCAGDHQHRKHRGPAVVMALAEPVQHQQQAPAETDRCQPRRGFVFAEPIEHQRDRPEIECRFVQIGQPVIAWYQPCARIQHFTGHFGIAPLIGLQQRVGAQVVGRREHDHGQHDQRSNSRDQAHRRRSGGYGNEENS